MCVGAGFYMYDVVVKSSRSLSNLLMSFLSCLSRPVCNVGVLWPNGWMDQNETWHAGRSPPRAHCIRWVPRLPTPEKGGTVPTFRPMPIVAKLSPISATAELVFIFFRSQIFRRP